MYVIAEWPKDMFEMPEIYGPYKSAASAERAAVLRASKSEGKCEFAIHHLTLAGLGDTIVSIRRSRMGKIYRTERVSTS